MEGICKGAYPGCGFEVTVAASGLGLLMTSFNLAPWKSDWLWSIPLIVLTIVFHAYGLGLLSQGWVLLLKRWQHKRLPRTLSVFIVGTSSFYATCLHGFEALTWAGAYCLLGVLDDRKERNAVLDKRHDNGRRTNLRLDPRWQLMGRSRH